jgi:predicted homoserine dehydrogenase-like protein
LLPGDVLDGIGGYCCYGEIRTVADPETPAAVPIGLADGATVKRAITKDEQIAFADVTLPVNPAVELFYENR